MSWVRGLGGPRENKVQRANRLGKGGTRGDASQFVWIGRVLSSTGWQGQSEEFVRA